MSVQTRFRWCTSTACFLPLFSAENIYSRAPNLLAVAKRNPNILDVCRSRHEAIYIAG